jgi:1,4-alpha-glucan branching enzyme
LNSDSDHYGGRGEGNLGGADAEDVPCDEHPYSLSLTLPALGALFFGAASERPKRTTIRRK